MAMTGEGLAAARRAAMDAVAFSQTSDQAAAEAYADAVLLADSTAIVEYIQAAARATGTDSYGNTHSLDID